MVPSHRRQSSSCWLATILIIAALLRLANLGGKSLWIDEGFSVAQSRLPPSAIWAGTQEQNHPPGYYLLLHYWPITSSEFHTRLPSAIASVASVLLLYLLARRVADYRVALASATILAVSPLDIWYAQEARMYAIATSAILLAALGLSLESKLRALFIVGGLTAGLYLYFAIIPLWLFLSGAWLVRWWRRSRQPYPIMSWLAASVCAILAFIPFWPKLFDFVGRLSDVFGVSAFLRLVGLQAPPGWILALLLAVSIAGCLLVATYIPRLLAGNRADWITILLIAGFILVTIMIPIPRLYSLKRVAVIGWPYIVLFVAWLVVTRAWWRGRTLSVVLTVSCVASIVSIFFIEKTDFRGAVAYLDQAASPEDVVWMDAKSSLLTYRFYEPRQPGQSGGTEVLRDSLAMNQGIWLVTHRCPRCGTSPNQKWLDANMHLLRTVSFYGLDVRLYQAESE